MSTDVVMKSKTCWKVSISNMAKNTFNPIRAIVDTMKVEPHPDKPMIALSIGDPTVFGNLPTPETCRSAVISSITSDTYNGYAPSVGYTESRQAVADYVSTPRSKVEAKDVVLASGCSGALDLCVSCLADPGQNILIPRPGFSLYKTLGDSLGIEVKQYDLLPERSWEVDLEHLESLIDGNTKAIVVCNPSNPCGSVYTADHLIAILGVAEEHKIPIIADEVYDRFADEDTEHGLQNCRLFSALRAATCLRRSPSASSCLGAWRTYAGQLHLSRRQDFRFLVPGWRMGWVVVHDKHGVFADVLSGLVKLSQRILGPNTLVQAALPEILTNTPQSFFSDTIRYLEDNARMFYSRLSEVQGLRPVMPQGAMYMMVGIEMEHFPGFATDVDFTEKMITEQSVFCLPATCFQYPNFFRVVLTVPKEKVDEACTRITEFCQVHYQAVVDSEMTGIVKKNGHKATAANGHTTLVSTGRK